MKSKKLLSFILTAAMTISLLSTFTLSSQTVLAAENLDQYSLADIEAINRIIDDNGLKGYEKDAPDTWDFVKRWTSENNKNFPMRIELNNKKLTGTLDVSNMSRLKYLECEGNNLTGLNVSNLENLKSIYCKNNKISSLDLTGLTNLDTLQCNYNSLESLNVSGLSKITDLRFFGNSNLTTVTGLSDCTSLKILNCDQCKLGSLDVSSLINLKELYCHTNGLSEITGLNDKTALSVLYCYSNKLTGLDVSGCSALTKLWCSNNEINQINGLQDCTQLGNFDCRNNSLTALDLSVLQSTCTFKYANNKLTEVKLPTGTIKIENVSNGTAYISEISLSENRVNLAQKPDDGYVFCGWYTSRDMTDADKIDSAVEVSTNMTIYPKFSKTISNEISVTAPVKYAAPQKIIDTEEYTATVKWSPDIPDGGNFAANTEYTATIEITPKANYTNYGITDYVIDGAETVTLNADGTVSAVFPKTAGSSGGGSLTSRYTVRFDTDGGNTITSQTVKKNGTATEPTAPAKDGYIFDGWYTDSKFEAEYDFDTKVTKNITLYAKWVEDEVQEPSDDNKDDSTGDEPQRDEWKNPFTDVKENDWFFNDVKYVNENGLMSGTTNTTFAPDRSLTRGMLVTILYRLAGAPAVNKSIPFADVKADMYYADAVIWAEQNGIVSGISETEFAPDENITREQMATIIYRYAEYKGIAPTGAWAIKLDYADAADISDYAVEGVMYCTMKNIMQGKDNNMFAPKDNATRAEISAILNRFIEGNK